jgi:hypothetical protein
LSGSVPLGVVGGLTTVPLGDSGGLTTVPIGDSFRYRFTVREPHLPDGMEMGVRGIGRNVEVQARSKTRGY